MISRKKYESIIKNFLGKWEKVMSKEIADDVLNIWTWVKDYEDRMGKGSTEEKKQYVKRGTNLMKRFVDTYTRDNMVLSDSLLKCKLALLRGDTKLCNERTKAELTALIKEYNLFTSAMIGCNDKGMEYMLSLLKRTSGLLGDEYFKIKQDLELKCLSLQKEMLEI
jgi:hypothetical protein